MKVKELNESQIKNLIEKAFLEQSDKLIQKYHCDKMIEFSGIIESYLKSLDECLQYRLYYQLSKVVELKLNNIIQILYDNREECMTFVDDE